MNDSKRQVTAVDERVFQWLLRESIRRPKLVLSAWLVILVALLAPALGVEIDTSTDNVLDRSDPAWEFYRKSVEAFGGDEVVVVAVEGGEPLDSRLARRIVELSEQLDQIEGVSRVDSLSTVPLVRFSEDLLEFVPGLASGSEDLEEVRDRVARDLVARDSLISRDLRVGAVNVRLGDDLGASVEGVVNEIRAVADRQDAWVSGVPIFRTEINTTAGAEIVFFVAATVLLVGLVLAFLFRSVTAVITPLAVGGFGTVATLAAMSVSETPITLSTVILPSIMLALGCAYSMHFLAAAAGTENAESLERSLAPVVRPTALSGLTTTIGFLAISQVRIDAIREVGGFGALGVLWVLAVVVTAVPAALALWPLTGHRVLGVTLLRQRTVPLLARLWGRGGRGVLIASAVGVVVLGVGLSRVNVETDVTLWFPRGHEVRESYEIIRERLSGISSMNVVIESTDGESLTVPERIAAIEGLSSFLGNHSEIGKSLAITDPLRQIHGGFREDSSLPLPDGRSEIEQYLLLLDSVTRTRDLISLDRLQANILLRVDNNGSKELLAIAELVDEWWLEHGPSGVAARATGIMYEFARAEDEMSFGQIRGLALALLAIGAILLAIYRSVSLAGVGLVPNVVPLIAVFGFLGLIDVPLDAGLVISACLILGISVDNTLHVVSGFVASPAVSARDALVETFRRVLIPLVASTVVVGTGFSVLAFSNFVFVRNLGLLVVSVMVVCLLADVVLLPAILMRTHGRKQEVTVGARSA